MSRSMVVLDSMEFEGTERKDCILRGWIYVDCSRTLDVEVCAGDKILECKMRRVRRADVVKARLDLSFDTEEVGFEIRIPEMADYFSANGNLQVKIVNDVESLELLNMNMDEVKEKYNQSTMKYYIEKVSLIEKKICIQGWCIDLCGGFKLELYDDSRNMTDQAMVSQGRRTDVSAAYQVEPEYCHGFAVTVSLQEIKGNKINLHLKNKAAVCVEMIDLSSIKKEQNSFWRNVKKRILQRNSEEMKEWKRQRAEVFEHSIKFSIVVPLYHTPTVFLKKMIDSVIAQSYVNWELCLADGSANTELGEYIKKHYGKERRIHYRYLEENRGISGNTNAALAMAKGDFIVFADHDDTMSSGALYEAARELMNYPETEMIYTDEELVDREGKSISRHFKPDFNLDYLRSVNYICHLLMVKRSLLERVGTLQSEYDGAQDYDFVLRCVEQTSKIRHIPKILYQWRSHEGSTAGNQDSKTYAVEAGKRALEAHYRRMRIDAEVEFSGLFIVYRTIFKIKNHPLVSILIPNKDHVADLKKCLNSIWEKSTWKHYEIIIIENNSTESETFDYYEELKDSKRNVRIVSYDGIFNYSAINNLGASYANGEYLLLLNNDTEVITPDWMEEMLGICQRDDTGVVGAKLYYPDDTVQHAGIVVGMGGFAGHIQTGYDKSYAGYMNRLKTIQDISAVTGACMMVKKNIYQELNGLDEGFAVALNDVDFCLRVRELHKLVVFQPYAELYHYESKSRGFETTPEKKARFQKEIDKFQERYQQLLEQGDPYYNPNLSLEHGDCSTKQA